MKSIGIDLAGKKENPTGISIIRETDIIVRTVYSNKDITKVVAIDAPLSFSENCGLRDSDSKLIERGHRVFPPDFGGMEVLTYRAIRISERLKDSGFWVIESHPLTSGKILFDSKDREDWITSLDEKGLELEDGLTEHEIDSIILAFVGLLFWKGEVEKVGRQEVFIPVSQAEDS